MFLELEMSVPSFEAKPLPKEQESYCGLIPSEQSAERIKYVQRSAFAIYAHYMMMEPTDWSKPPRLDHALLLAIRDHPLSTRRLFLKCGLEVWYAYFSAEKVPERWTTEWSRAWQWETLAMFDKLSRHHRYQVAAILATKQCHASAERTLQLYLGSDLNDALRNVLCGKMTVKVVSTLPPLPSDVKRARNKVKALERHVHDELLERVPIAPAEASDVPDDMPGLKRYFGTNLAGLAEYFNPETCKSICWLDSKSVQGTVIQGIADTTDCLLSLSIKDWATPRIALGLFDVQVEDIGRYRFFFRQGECFRRIGKSIFLRRARKARIAEILGAGIERSISESTLSQDDQTRDAVFTRGVSLLVATKPETDACLHICLGGGDCHRIIERLFPDKSP